ncbi:sulfatase/phosphatase domain-containing protein [Nocardioides convexus]|uniref:sulfatase/phosphatase domain-containing protein n=1 Tax=Nocardioides convexus TaxID=2712224 RepID=UPI002418593B|nr:sulfatase/phosphatase domain-containing protein [Nocardioides convexus]
MIIGEHGLGMTKVRAHEPSLRVPMLITGPGLRTAQKRYDPISTVDLTATILDLGDAKAPVLADGSSRVKTLVDGDQGWTTPIVTEAVFTARGRDPLFTDLRTTIGIRTSRYSFTRYRGGQAESLRPDHRRARGRQRRRRPAVRRRAQGARRPVAAGQGLQGPGVRPEDASRVRWPARRRTRGTPMPTGGASTRRTAGRLRLEEPWLGCC